MMTAGERETVLKHLGESRKRLLATVEGLSPEQLHYRPEPGRWTVSEIVEHLTTVEGRVLGLIQKTLSEGPSPTKRSAMEGQDSALVEGVIGRLQRFQAPEYLQPKGRWPDDELLNAFEATRRQTRDFVSTTDGDLRKHFYPHPVIGELDLYQWLLLISAHCDRHRAQTEEVMASTGFPQQSERKSAS
ncbi:MAG TPA: DinB family protein [Candidatus Acidoferrales bacterium]|nr:DinB family protein [Candidatus Acidoferrales bacterium]